MKTNQEHLAAQLAAMDARYDSEQRLLWSRTYGIGYHTRLPADTDVHPIRESLAYAVTLLGHNDPAGQQRGRDILDRVLTLQVTDPTEATFGIWSWFMEEPVEKMGPPDWNWADFCGLSLAEILAFHASTLDDELAGRVRVALGNAGWAIFRRNVQPGYTNIAVMGGGVCVAAGQLLNEPRLLAYGQQRLQRCVEHLRWTGGFNEYNSPTYAMVVLHDVERLLVFLRDEAARQSLTALLQGVWEMIAQSYHAPTGQWAGPHSRTYHDFLNPGTRADLLARVAAGISSDAGAQLASPALPCPAHLAAGITAPLPEPREIRRRFIRQADDTRSTTGVTWQSTHASLGSVNFDNLWVQRRPVLGYLRTARENEPALLRLRFLRDGKDFASAGVRNEQRGPRVLSGITLLTDKGDYHTHLDAPADGIFRTADLRVSYQLHGPEVRLVEHDATRLRASVGDAVVTLALGPAMFDGQPVTWAVRQDEDGVKAEAVFYQGDVRALDFRLLGPCYAVAGAVIGEAAVKPIGIITSGDGGEIAATWEGLAIKFPARPHRYDGWLR